MRRSPRCLGVDRTRWTRAALREAVPWLAGLTPRGVGGALAALGLTHKRARDHVHGPDPAYAEKRDAVAESLAEARASGGRVVALFQDEVTLHRQPTLAPAWEARGRAQPLAERSLRPDGTAARVVATLDAADGRVLARRRASLSVPALVGFYREVVAAYPDAERIDVVLDNWPVHFHPDLLAALRPQEFAFPVPRPPSWPEGPSAEAVRKWGGLDLPIRLVQLPTYAPWLNPVEQLWRWLRRDVGHLHPWADDPAGLREAADRFLARFADPSPDLLRYVGLEPAH